MITTPFAACAALCALITAATWLLSVITREYSWVDRIWSIAPPIYVGIFAGWLGFADPRLNLLFLLTTAWGLRLTLNYARKGGYAPGGEDYRWAILRERLGPVAFQVFNATFISPYQNLLILLIALPASVCYDNTTPLRPIDGVLAALFVALLAIETLADQQQWRFHQAKLARKAAGEPEPKGFVDTGLWAYSRHPNFFGEIGQWWVVYAFSLVASATLYNWTLIGPVLLTALFYGSTAFTEQITAAKYPAYADYQRRVSRWVPWPPKSA